jgi:hypothetical protein
MVYKNNFIAVVKHKGRIMRDRNGVVRMPFGSEYSILLKNKDSRTAIARISVDGEDVMGGHRYIIPGKSQRELTGFLKGLNATHKFRFIKKTKQIARYRGDRLDDGMVEVEFWYEQAVTTPWVIYDAGKECWPDPPDYTFGDSTAGRFQSSFTSHSTNFHQVQSSSPRIKSSITTSCNVSTPKRDEGITVKGSKAHQNFQYGNVGTLESHSSTIIIRLRGTVRKRGKTRPVKKVIATRSRIQCTTCGRKWRSHLKFCGNCSTALD